MQEPPGNAPSEVVLTGQAVSVARGESRRRYWVIFLLCLMYLITYMDRTNLSIIAPVISEEFHFDKLTMGVIFSAFSWSYTLFQIPCGYLGDRFGPRRTLGVFALYWSALTTVIVAAGSATTFWLARFFFGIGEAGAFPTATRAMTHWVPATERGIAQGLTHGFSRLGAALTPLITVWIAARWGWRAAFLLFGFMGGVWAIGWLVTYRDRPEEDKRVSEAELAVIRLGNGTRQTGPDQRQTRPERQTMSERTQTPWAALFKSGNMWAINLQYFAYGYSLWFYLTWLPTYFKDVRHFSFMMTGIYSSLPFLTGMLGDGVGGWLCDRIAKKTGSLRLARTGVGAVAMITTVIFLIPGAVTGQPHLAVILLSLAAFFLEMNIGPAWAVVMDVGHEYAGTVSGMMNMCGSLAGALSPIIFAAVWERTGSAVLPFAISGSLMAVGAVAWLFVDPARPVLVERRLDDATL